MTPVKEHTTMQLTEELEHSARRLEERVQSQADEVTGKVTRLNDRVTTYIKTNPGKCLLGAIAAGYIIGRITGRA